MPRSVDAQFLVTTECITVTSAMRRSSRWVNAGIAAILGAPADTHAGSGTASRQTRLRKTTGTPNPAPERSSVEVDVREEEPLLEATKPAETGGPSMAGPGTANHGVAPGAPDGEDQEPARDGVSEPEFEATDEDLSESALIIAFAGLRGAAARDNGRNLTALQVAKPFLEIVKSPLVSGHITSLALSSLEKFIVLGLISPGAPQIRECLSELVHALTHCRFEATDRHEDDAVLLQLMVLLDRIISGPCGVLLSSRTVAEVVETCLSMAFQLKRGDTLQRSVVATLMSLVRTVFAHHEDASMEKAANETLQVLIGILDPAQLQNTNATRITVLTVLKACFEVAGSWLGHNETSLKSIRQLWNLLAQLVRTTTSPRLVREALQLVATITNTVPEKFKLEFGFILVYLLTSLTPLADLPRDVSTTDMFYAGVPNRAKSVKSAPLEPGSDTLAIPTAALQKSPEIREVMVESLATLASASPSLYSDLFITYDCDRGSPDLCEDLVGFLCRNAYPDSATWSTASVPPLCLEAVLSGLSAWVEASDRRKMSPEIGERLKQRFGKSVETKVAETFNQSSKKGIEAMVTHKLIPDDSPESVARFLCTSKRVNKTVLGQFLSKRENQEVLKYYMQDFDFSGQRLDQALRTWLSRFRLPGESGQIENLLEIFSERYMEPGNRTEQSKDEAFSLSYAILLLNTDQFNPMVKRRMEFEDYLKTVRSLSLTVPDEYVKEIFDAIRAQEIVMPEEHDTDDTFEQSWRAEVLAKLPGDPYYCGTSSLEVIKAVFDKCWKPIVSTLSFVFATATDDLVFRRVITGFHQAAILATRFRSQQALNHIVACLSQISVLASGDLSFPNTNIEIRIEDHVSVIVSDLSTQIGSDLKAQMASITLFRMLRIAAKEIGRNAFGLVAKALVNLHIYGLGTPTTLINVKPLKPVHTFERSKAGKPVGIFSALSNYLTSSPDTPAEPSDESVDAALGAADCIKACNIELVLQKLVASSPRSFAEGILDIVPRGEDPKYLPAKEFALRLTGYAAENLPDVREQAANLAAASGLNATALQIAPESTSSKLLANLQEIDDETAEVLVTLQPSQYVWQALGLIKAPTPKIWEYAKNNSSQVTSESLEPVLSLLGKAEADADGQIVAALEDLAQKFRHDSDYTRILAVLANLCGSPDAATRENALGSLQRELLQEDQQISWATVVESVLLPNVFELLLKPEVWKRDPKGMDVTRQQAAGLVAKVYLHLTVSLNKDSHESDDRAWFAVLRALDRLLSSRRQPALQESVEEMLKNVILVMKLSSRGSSLFWTTTEKELKGFLPEIAALTTQEPGSEKQDSTRSEGKAHDSGAGATKESEQASTEQASTEQASTEQASTEQASTEQTSTEQASTEQTSTEQSSNEQTSPEQSRSAGEGGDAGGEEGAGEADDNKPASSE